MLNWMSENFGSMILGYLVLVISIAVGWVMNLIDIINGFPIESSEMGVMIVRIIGVFIPPLGAIMGFFF